MAEAGVANRDLLLRRANELSDAVAEQFSLESGSGVELELDSVTRALAALELPSASTFVDARRTARLGALQRPAGGVRAADGAERRPAHDAADHPARGAASARWSGRKLFQMEGKRQRAYRQGQAKAAAGKFVDEVAFEMNKDTRDGLRRTQRRLRDEFQSRAGSIQASTGAALAAARRASDLPPTSGPRGPPSSTRRRGSSGGSGEDMRSLATAGAALMADDLTGRITALAEDGQAVGVRPRRPPRR